MGKSHYSSHDTHIQRPPLSLTKERRDRTQGSVITDVCCCCCRPGSRQSGVEWSAGERGESGRRRVDGLFNRSFSIVRAGRCLGAPGEREDYQEINSKTGLALLTSQGSAQQCPHGNGCQYRLVLLRIQCEGDSERGEQRLLVEVNSRGLHKMLRC